MIILFTFFSVIASTAQETVTPPFGFMPPPFMPPTPPFSKFFLNLREFLKQFRLFSNNFLIRIFD